MNNDASEIKFSNLSQMMTVKNQLIIASVKELVDLYKDADDETLEMLYEGVELNFKFDEPFFYLENGKFLNKLFDMITILKEKHSPKYLKEINNIIVSINVVRTRNEIMKKEELKKYIDRQEYFRDSYLDEDILISSFCYDALVLKNILYQNLDSIKEKDFVLASLNYLIRICPMFFKDEDIRQIVDNELNNISKLRLNRDVKKYTKDTKKLLRCVNKEG